MNYLTFISLGVAAVVMFLMFYWLVFEGPRRSVLSVMKQSPEVDKNLPLFRDVDPSWNFLRLLPLPGWKTAWSIQRASGEKLGEVIIKGRLHVDSIVIRGHRFEVRRYVQGPVFRGYLFKSDSETGKLETDRDFGIGHHMKANFKNLRGTESFDGLFVQSDRAQRLVLLQGSERRGVGNLKIGSFPGFLALAPDFSDKELVSLVYAMLLT